jgi:hypothetical protein
MPAHARRVELALRAGVRKPSGEEAADSNPGVSGYGDSGCRCGSDSGRMGPGVGEGQDRTSGSLVRSWGWTPTSANVADVWRSAGYWAQQSPRQDPGAMADEGVADGHGGAHELSHHNGPRRRARQVPPRPMTSMIRTAPPHGQAGTGAALGSPGAGACSGVPAGGAARSRMRARSSSRERALGPLASRP